MAEQSVRAPKPTAAEAAAQDAAYNALRDSGVMSKEASERLGLRPYRAQHLERLRRAAILSVPKVDSSCPKFARDDEHVARVIAAGGFAHLSEKRFARGVVVPSLPLVPFHPAKARADV